MKLPLEFKKNLQQKIQADRRLKNRAKVVDFFLNLYTVQMKCPKIAPKQFKQLDKVQGELFTYELAVKSFDKWTSRLMGITHLGETGGGKSKCFKVTYDDVLVVKIPRKPISNLSDYIEGIKIERQIATKLAPEIHCIAPQVSPILKRIPTFYEGMGWMPEEIEDKCTERLLQFPQFQEYLKIDGSFVYFMDISKYSFLSQIIKDMFNIDDKIQQEIIWSPDIILNFHKFEEKYGLANVPVWLNINDVYKEYERKIDNILDHYGLTHNISPYRKRYWFLRFLIKKEDITNEPGVSSTFFDELNVTIKDLLYTRRAQIQRFIQTVSDHVRQEIFNQNTGRISSIITSILRLVTDLKEKQVALRDLKPDNMFVMMELARNSVYWAYENVVRLGLIDLETAISFEIPKNKSLKQPLLGGTPSYATPSNFVENSIIEAAFEKVPRILHLQDWHAAVCIIFITTTGKPLFVQSRNMLYKIIKLMTIPESQRPPMKDFFQKNSLRFWLTAKEEFQKKTDAHQASLKAIKISLPTHTQKIFYQEAINQCYRIHNIIQQKIKDQDVFKARNSIDKLTDASCEMLKTYRKRWENGINVPRIAPEARLWIIDFIKELEELKSLVIQYDRWSNTFSQKDLFMTAFDIMQFMFQVVLQEMSMTLGKIQHGRAASFEITKEKKVSIENTFKIKFPSNES
jgi:serine/threonine protein kinase